MEIYFMQSPVFCCIMPSTHIDIQCLSLLIWALAILKESYTFNSERLRDVKVKSMLVSVHNTHSAFIYEECFSNNPHDHLVPFPLQSRNL